jgi:hypothetical protein
MADDLGDAVRSERERREAHEKARLDLERERQAEIDAIERLGRDFAARAIAANIELGKWLRTRTERRGVIHKRSYVVDEVVDAWVVVADVADYLPYNKGEPGIIVLPNGHIRFGERSLADVKEHLARFLVDRGG